MAFEGSVLTRQDLIDTYQRLLKDTKLEPKDIWVGAGGASLMHGLRETTNDIDAGCYLDTLHHVARVLRAPIHTYGRAQGYMFDGQKILHLEDYVTDLHEEAREPEDLVMIEGVNVYSLESLLAMKLKLNRPKDQDEIRKLKKLLGRK